MHTSPTTITAVLRDPAILDETVFCHFIQRGRETPITYGELRVQAARYAHFFRSEGIKSAEVVVIVLRHSPELFYSFLGAMLMGAIPSFMPFPTDKQDPRLYWNSHQKLFNRIGAGALVTAREHRAAVRENLPDLSLRLIAAEDAPDGAPAVTLHLASPGDTAFLQHSSGTTGLKKGVALSHAAVLRQITSYASALQLSPSDRIVSWLPLYHDMGLVACFMLPLLTRTPVVMLDPFEWVANPVLLLDAIKAHRATLCWMPNFAFHHLCRTVRPSPRLDLSSMRAWIDCSEPCRAETFELFARHFASVGTRPEDLQVCYAMAETVFAVTQTSPPSPQRVLRLDPEMLRTTGQVTFANASGQLQRVLSAGRPIDGLRIRITDDAGTTLPDNRVGEICVTGDCLFTGYYRLDDETHRKLRGGWYHTGDLGFLHEGELYVTGRKNDLIIVHGRNYYAHELEYIVNQVPGTHPGRNVATGWFRPEVGSEEVVIIAECRDSAPECRTRLVRDIKDAVLTHAGLHVFDVHLVSAGWLVKTTSGKLSRVDNLNKYLAALAAPAAQSA